MNKYEDLIKLADDFEKQASKSDFTPIESLMLEHSILDRLLLVYEKCIAMIEADDLSALKIIKKVALLIRKEIELHHERAEEKLIFKKLTDAKKLTKTINTLIEQHKISKKITDQIILLASHLNGIIEKNELITLIKSFVRMYKSHAAIENTFVFPELRNLMDKKDFKRFSRWFDKREEAMFGKEEDLQKIVKVVEGLEKEVGINKLEKFTP